MVPRFSYKKGKLFFPWVLSTQVSPARRRLINSWRSLHNKYRLCKPEAPQSACKAELGGLGHRLTPSSCHGNESKLGRKKKHLQRLASNSPTTSFWLQWLLCPPVCFLSRQRGVGGGTPSPHGNIDFINPILELQQLQLALEAFPGGLGEVWVSGSTLRPQQGMPQRAEATGTSPEPCRMRPQLVQAEL